jgi:ribosomal protein S18 acetylase RimI-like enzyme
LIYLSGPADLDFILATRAVDAQAFLRYAYAHGAGRFGWRNHVTGESAEGVIAVGAAWSSRSSLFFTRSAARQFLSVYGPITAAGVAWRGLRAESVLKPPRPGELYIGHICVHPDHRRRGIARKLLEYLMERGRGAGLQSAVLDVATDNAPARALYEGLGFRLAAERRSHLANAYGRIADHDRMVRAL